jgi:hypothetical protein
VSDIVKGVLGGAWGLVVGWFLPCALVLAVFGVVVLPDLRGVPLLGAIASAPLAGQATVLVVAAVVLGLVLSVAQTPLYRVLEGYLAWPARLRKARTARHQARRGRLRAAVDAGSRGTGALSLADSQALELFLRYPPESDQVAPTMLGNAIRRFEQYAQDRYQLDSQLLWYQLRSVVPDPLVKATDDARAGVDFFVCLGYLSLVLAVVSGATAATHPHGALPLVLTAIVAALTAPGCYRGAILATDSWSAAVRAMVDLGRLPLAKAYGLTLPATLEEEREMWQVLGWLIAFPYRPDAAEAIDRWRPKPDSGTPSPSERP